MEHTQSLSACRFLKTRFGAPFRKTGYKLAFALSLLGLAAGQSIAQTKSFPRLVYEFQEHGKKAFQEKVFLHLDRPAYACGETMWFKVYNVDGMRHQPLDMSKVAYVEVLDAGQKPVLQGKISLKKGTGSGSLVLPVTLEPGNYTVRAYTNWMKNFSPAYYFQQPVTIINTFQPLGLKSAADTAAYAIQFFPEGGNLVQGLPSKVAFKATNSKTGKGASFQGEVLDKAGKVVASFQPARSGIGNFSFTPSGAGEYTAVVRFAGGKTIRQKLPQVQAQGFSLRVEESKPGQLQITAQGNQQEPEQLYLLGHTRGTVAVAATATLQNGKALFSVQKDSMAAGITHFTLFNGQHKPVAERLFFTTPTRGLEIETTLSKPQFGPREKVTMDLLTQSKPGTPTAANLSLAVFRNDNLQATDPADIRAYLYLTSDLKGTVENPSAYFTQTGPQAEEALDNLMLTHGWSRFTWEEVLNPQITNYAFVPEYGGHLIRGKVTHSITGASVKDIRTYLAAPGRNVRFYSSVSAPDGSVLFEAKDFFGPKEVVVQTNWLKDSTYHFQLLNPFSEKQAENNLHALDLSENLKEAILLRHHDVQAQNIYFERNLNRFKAPGIDSISFYGKPDQQFLLDDFTRFKVMEEVMREYVPGVMVRKRRDGFHFLVMDLTNDRFFQEDPLVLLDGVPVFDIDQIMAFDPLKVRKLEVMTGKYYNGSLVSSGVVSYTTYKGDLAGFPVDTRALLQEYEGLQLQREFYAPTYDTEEQKLSRLPDWRNLLYWSPDLTTEATGKATAQFYTGDQAGTYTVVVQGLTKDGLPGSKIISFEVKKPL
ncbi:hypothetical protein [Rufibacter hautae]|uniref:Macroglobulin domain-containing protein n=1 Tax=Rufibacter hautae TaxID=2595005 RepID=A0A5B6TEP8_9BACT|nr:hypothetical protein [Rufibacter hautae]KAA3438636.1 hypothetical protein FOA19_15550 [Rufibacter hautae]